VGAGRLNPPGDLKMVKFGVGVLGVNKRWGGKKKSGLIQNKRGHTAIKETKREQNTKQQGGRLGSPWWDLQLP